MDLFDLADLLRQLADQKRWPTHTAVDADGYRCFFQGTPTFDKPSLSWVHPRGGFIVSVQTGLPLTDIQAEVSCERFESWLSGFRSAAAAQTQKPIARPAALPERIPASPREAYRLGYRNALNAVVQMLEV